MFLADESWMCVTPALDCTHPGEIEMSTLVLAGQCGVYLLLLVSSCEVRDHDEGVFNVRKVLDLQTVGSTSYLLA